MRLADILVFPCILLSTACSGAGESDSRIQHVWGQTRRGELPMRSSRVCESSFSGSPGAMRLQQLASRIAEANPQTFYGELDSAHLCIGIDTALKGADARSTPEQLRVAFSSGLVDLAQNDGQLAAVLSHELAHLSLQHRGFAETPPVLGSDSNFTQLQSVGRDVQAEIVRLALAKADPQQIFALNDNFADVLRRMNSRIDEVYGEKNAHVNWIEQEADDVGAEFFLRAGFNPDDYIEILWRSARGQRGETRDECEALVEAHRAKVSPAPRPERGAAVHPTTCWRVFHLTVDEWTHAHSAEIGTLNPR